MGHSHPNSQQQHQQQQQQQHRGLVVGNYTHDTLFRKDSSVNPSTSLGGAVSFISNILPTLGIQCDYISKVGPDFLYSVPTPPIVVPTATTTKFSLSLSPNTSSISSSSHDRTLTRLVSCEPVLPSDIPPNSYKFGMAVGVAGEILYETLQKMVEVCEVVFVDVQGLIRMFDENDGRVSLRRLEETGFYRLVSRIGVLKASEEEAEFVDVEEVRKVCCVVVTYGENGCRVYWKDGEMEIGPFRTLQVDPTGAGDSLLGGFVAGVVSGLPVPDAALLGNFFGCLTVEQIGLPKFDPKLLKRVKDEVQKRALQCAEHRVGDEDDLWFSKPPGHDEFQASLNSVKQSFSHPGREFEFDLSDKHNHVRRPTNPGIKHHCNGQMVLPDPVYDEPVQSVSGTP